MSNVLQIVEALPVDEWEGLDDLQDDRRNVERLAVRLERQGKREPVGVRRFQHGRERDRFLANAERPCLVELDAPALGAERGKHSRDECDAGRGRVSFVPVSERGKDEIRIEHPWGRPDLVAQRAWILAAMALRRLHERLPEAGFPHGVALDDGGTAVTVGLEATDLAGPQPPNGILLTGGSGLDFPGPPSR